MNRRSSPVLLKQAVAERQRGCQLTAQQMAALQQRVAQVDAASPSVRGGRWLVGLAAGVGALAGVLLAVWLLGLTPPADGRSMLERVADEVAANHLKQRPLEVTSNNLDTLRRYFTALDFQPVQTPPLAPRNGRLLGGRYCSVQGKTAAQFRVATSGGNLRTVYEVRYDPHVHGPVPDMGKGERPINLVARGVNVRLWVDGGVLFAVTGMPQGSAE